MTKDIQQSARRSFLKMGAGAIAGITAGLFKQTPIEGKEYVGELWQGEYVVDNVFENCVSQNINIAWNNQWYLCNQSQEYIKYKIKDMNSVELDYYTRDEYEQCVKNEYVRNLLCVELQISKEEFKQYNIDNFTKKLDETIALLYCKISNLKLKRIFLIHISPNMFMHCGPKVGFKIECEYFN